MNRDFTNKILQSTEGNLVNFILAKPGDMKLILVKAIKNVTLLGLKDSKDFVDLCSSGPVMFSKLMTKEQTEWFRNELNKCDNIEYELTGVESIRNRGLIGLGLCERNEVVEELSKDLSYRFLMLNNREDLSRSIGELLSHIDQETLVKIFNSQNDI